MNEFNFIELKAQLNVKTAEISELKIQLDDAKSSTKREVLAQEDLQKHYQHRLKEKQAEIDSFKRYCETTFQRLIACILQTRCLNFDMLGSEKLFF